MKDSLQEIADAYGRAGLCGQRLRTALAKDSRYQQLLRARKQKLTKQFRHPLGARALCPCHGRGLRDPCEAP